MKIFDVEKVEFTGVAVSKNARTTKKNGPTFTTYKVFVEKDNKTFLVVTDFLFTILVEQVSNEAHKRSEKMKKEQKIEISRFVLQNKQKVEKIYGTVEKIG